MSAATAALIGVAVGALLSGAVQLAVTTLLDRHKTGVDRRVAARLMIEALEWVETKVASIADKPRDISVHDVKHNGVVIALWEQYNDTFAAVLPLDKWKDVAWVVGELRVLLEEGRTWSGEDLDALRESVPAAHQALRAYQ